MKDMTDMMNMSEGMKDMTDMMNMSEGMKNMTDMMNMSEGMKNMTGEEMSSMAMMKLRSILHGMSKQELMEMVQDMAPMGPMDKLNKMCSDECQESYGVIASDACRPFSGMMGMDNESMGNESMRPIEMLTSMCSDCFLMFSHLQPTCEDTGMDLCIPGTPCREAVVDL